MNIRAKTCIGIIVCIASYSTAMENEHRYTDCPEQKAAFGCPLCHNQYPVIWKKYATNFTNEFENIKNISEYERPFRTNKIGEMLLKAFSQKKRSDRVILQITALKLVPCTGDDSAQSIKTLTALYKSKLISECTYTRALKIKAYHHCLTSFQKLAQYYLEKSITEKTEKICQKAKLCYDILIESDDEMAVFHNCYLAWMRKQDSVARDYLTGKHKSLHNIIMLLKMVQSQPDAKRTSLANLILSALCNNNLSRFPRCLLCYAGLNGFYQGINAYNLEIPKGMRSMINVLLGDNQEFIQQQGAAAISTRTLLDIKSKPN